MDVSTTFALSVSLALAILLSIDLLVAAVRSRHLLMRRLDHPLRVVAGSTLCAAILFGAVRPATAVTPPPSVRLVDIAPNPVAPDAPSIGIESETTHVVEPGDSLWRVARLVLERRGLPAAGHDVATYWPVLYEANREVIGADPNLIHPGQVLVLPEAPIEAGATHGA